MPTFNQLIHHGREEKWHKDHTRASDQCPQKQGVCPHVSTRTSKKPNSALCNIAKVWLSNRYDIFAYIPSKGHNSQEHSIVLVREDRVNVRQVRNPIVFEESRICWEFRIIERADLNVVQKDQNRNEWKMPLECHFLSAYRIGLSR